MSLILDALRKSDRERQRNAEERLREGPRPARVAAPPAWLMPVLLAALLCSAGALAWVVFSQERPPAAPLAGEAGQNVQNSPPRAAVRPLRSELPRPRPQSAPQAAIQESEPAAAMTPADVDVEPLPPSLAELPPAFRDSVPALAINAHAWSANPAARFVLINLRRYAEGDTLAEGPRLLRIRPEGVVLEFQGEQFFLPRR